MDVREYLDQVRIEASVKAVDMSDVKFNREVYRQHVDHHQENQALNNMGVRQGFIILERKYFGGDRGGGGGGVTTRVSTIPSRDREGKGETIFW